MAAIRMAARVEPTTEPMPPRMLTPPTTEAVMMVSSRLGGTVDWITESWVANRTEAMPAKAPWIRNTCRITVRRSMPASRAASALPPTGVDAAAEAAVAHPPGGGGGEHHHEPDRHGDAQGSICASA